MERYIKTFEQFSNEYDKIVNEGKNLNLDIGKTYNFKDGTQINTVEYIGTYKDNPDIKIDATFKDFKSPKYIFKFLDGDSAIASHGRKGAYIGLSDKTIKKHISI